MDESAAIKKIGDILGSITPKISITSDVKGTIINYQKGKKQIEILLSNSQITSSKNSQFR